MSIISRGLSCDSAVRSSITSKTIGLFHTRNERTISQRNIGWYPQFWIDSIVYGYNSCMCPMSQSNSCIYISSVHTDKSAPTVRNDSVCIDEGRFITKIKHIFFSEYIDNFLIYRTDSIFSYKNKNSSTVDSVYIFEPLKYFPPFTKMSESRFSTNIYPNILFSWKKIFSYFLSSYSISMNYW